ncbi:MAG: SDR family NAD(P)-dependent oxidoreductase [Microbacteriaceae bacterium]
MSKAPAEFDLTGRTALVTGAGSPNGIGFAAARILGELGARVIITSTTTRIRERVQELAARGIDAHGIVARLESPELVDALVANVGELSISPDIVVNNAGMIATGDEWARGDIAMPAADWRATIDGSLSSTFYVSRAFIPAMIERGWGRIINVSSTTGGVGAARDDIAYAAAKAGVIGLTRALAVDSAAHGVTVNSVAPGWIATGSQLESEVVEGTLVPAGRSGTPAEVGSVIASLATPGSSYITGQVVVVDGGNAIAEERRFARGDS